MAVSTNRSRLLGGLQMPVANRQATERLQATRAMQLQSSVAGAPSPAPGAPPVTKAAVQQAGAEQAAQAGQIAVQGAQKELESTGQAAQTALQGQANQDAQRLGDRKLVLQQTARKNESRLASLDRDVKEKLFDARTQFARDEAGRARMNEAQLADWAVQKARDENEFRAKMQRAELAHRRRMAVLEVAHSKIAEQLQFEMQKKMQDRDQATTERLMRAKQALEMKMREEQADAANRQAMWSAGGAVVGAVAGSVGGPAGAAAGASAGSAAGSYASTQVD